MVNSSFRKRYLFYKLNVLNFCIFTKKNIPQLTKQLHVPSKQLCSLWFEMLKCYKNFNLIILFEFKLFKVLTVKNIVKKKKKIAIK